MKSRTKIAVALAIMFAGIAVASAWWWRSGRDQPAGGPATARVARRDFASAVQATGAIKPQVGAEVRVGARISGKLQRLHANIGDSVTHGQVIAELDKADLEAIVAQRQAEVAVGEARVADAEARLKFAELELGRAQALRRDQMNSQQDLDNAAMTLAIAQAASRLAQRQVDATKAALQESHARLSYATITAPISGVIGSVSTQEGETVSAGLSSPTFVTLIDLDRLQVDAFVDEVDIGKVRLGQSALFVVDAFPGKEFEGKVTAIYPKAVIQENVVNYDVVLEIQTPYAGLLRPDMTASVTILLEARMGVLAVPVQAVKREGGKNLVYASTGGGVEIREVKVGWKDGQWIEIAGGLEEGQTVLLDAPPPNPSAKERP